MSEDYSPINEAFNLKDYVDAATDAAKRTRWVTVVLVVTSVLIGIGWYNSLQWSWQLHRVRSAYASDPKFAARILDYETNQQIFDRGEKFEKPVQKNERHAIVDLKRFEKGDSVVQSKDDDAIAVVRLTDGSTIEIKEPSRDSPAERLRDLNREETLKSYIENVRLVKAPFFGIAFDVNDLGFIGGVGLIIILLLMRYSLSREIKNLNVSLREAVYHGELSAFYHALAMRQVFTVPEMKGEKKNKWLAFSPRVICLLPAVVFLGGVGYDYYSTFVIPIYSYQTVAFRLSIETVWLVLIFYLALRCWERQRHIDGVWDEHWARLGKLRSAVVRLKKDLVEEFGSDEDVDRALRKYRAEGLSEDTAF